MCFQWLISMYEIYELWMNKFCTIFVTKSWDAKFVMFFFVSYVQSPKLLKLQVHVTFFFHLLCVTTPPPPCFLCPQSKAPTTLEQT
jgi:hypothetical protein